MDSYGERIRVARKKARLTQTELGEKIGVTHGTISKWESNEITPNIVIFAKLPEALGCSVADLLPIELLPMDTKASGNPYWDRITVIANRQREKGKRKYDWCLEDNPALMRERIQHLEEELIDGLMYCEWIKDLLRKENGNGKEA